MVEGLLAPTKDQRLEYGLIESPTHLDPSAYTTLFTEEKRQFWKETTLARRSDVEHSSQIWSITPILPATISSGHSQRVPLSCIEGDDRASKLFTSIVSSDGHSVAIGPLEYCGTAKIALTSHRKKVVSAVRKSRADILFEALVPPVYDGSDPELTEDDSTFPSQPVSSSSSPIPPSLVSSRSSSPDIDTSSRGSSRQSSPSPSEEQPRKKVKRKHRSHISADQEISSQASSAYASGTEASWSSRRSTRTNTSNKAPPRYSIDKRNYTRRR
ncbi:hypothetical protein CPB83DRAFT_910284 [Crepidotus variabilis]|uniref:Uncharacterized protein n=1 Tax=Crepidotus variabilis TaxID=179855 RepID=A0A9P6E7T9_9AGAR|nr:hypothetical protein CPB83DRAFT_910284 [Crepidotus variabilis]